MYRYNQIGFFVLIVVWFSSTFYFSSKIKIKEQSYIAKKELISKYDTLKNRYSKQTLEKNKKKIIEFLEIFDISYNIKKSNRVKKDILTFELKKKNVNKIISYILNSNVDIYSMKIKKIDKYKISFEVII